MSSTLEITASHGVPFVVRIVRQGDRYGLNDCLTHDKPEPLVEFYDARYPHTAHGQFVSRYNAATLLDATSGLLLDGGVPEWRVDAANMATVRAWVAQRNGDR